MNREQTHERTNELIWRLFGGAERAARLTHEQVTQGWGAPVEDWERLSADGAVSHIERLSALGFHVQVERLHEGAQYSHLHHRPGGTVKTDYTRWAVSIEYQGGNRDGDEPDGAPGDSFFGTGDTLAAALAAALVDMDAEWADGRSIRAALGQR